MTGAAENFVGGLLNPVGDWLGGIITAGAGGLLQAAASSAITYAMGSVLSGDNPLTGALEGGLTGGLSGVLGLNAVTHGMQGAISSIGGAVLDVTVSQFAHNGMDSGGGSGSRGNNGGAKGIVLLMHARSLSIVV